MNSRICRKKKSKTDVSVGFPASTIFAPVGDTNIVPPYKVFNFGRFIALQCYSSVNVTATSPAKSKDNVSNL